MVAILQPEECGKTGEFDWWQQESRDNLANRWQMPVPTQPEILRLHAPHAANDGGGNCPTEEAEKMTI